ncbi:MAG TPA: glycosyltransferase family 4 protein [Brevefilum fermentans]|jgi:colanic acid/amylovoran biosynthesis glycosyltransferase|nr:glycosyltransferase family 4 protein [Chloroflexota bacterium]HQA27850.1 glycosyltransferase family 4 protein [Brevefilum fermentans]
MYRIALIYSNFYRPVKMYYTRWPQQFSSTSIKTRAYSLVSPRRSKDVESTTFYSEGYFTKGKRLINAYFSDTSYMSYWFRAQGQLSVADKLRLMITFGNLITYRPDILQLVNSTTYLKVKDLYLPERPKLISSFHGYDIVTRPYNDPVWNKYLGELFERADGLHFVSEWLRDKALALGAPEEKSKVIYAGVDSDFFNPTQKIKIDIQRQIKIISTGRLVELKGYQYAFKAVKLLLDQGLDIHYSIIGEGTAREQLSRLANDLEIVKNVSFLGTKDKTELRGLLDSSDIYLQPSLTEALGGAVLEACSMALPVVASSVGGIPEIIQNEANGLLVPPKNPEALACAIKQLVENPPDAQEMAASARKTVENKFSIEQETKKWLELYRSL